MLQLPKRKRSVNDEMDRSVPIVSTDVWFRKLEVSALPLRGRLRGRNISAGKRSLKGDVVVPVVAVLRREDEGSVDEYGDSATGQSPPL